MEVEAPVLAPQQAVSPPPAVAALSKKTPASDPKPRAARRKTLCDITNLSKREPVPDESAACPAAPPPASAGGAEEFAQLVKRNEELVRLLAERDEIIRLSGAEIEKLRLANWELARNNSQMMEEVNHGRNTLKALQHELACTRGSLKAKTSELEDVKKKMAAQRTCAKDAASGAASGSWQSCAGQGWRCGRCRARFRRIACEEHPEVRERQQETALGPTTSTKLALPKDKDRDASQRRKSMRIPQPSSLFEIEDVQLAISSCKIEPESASGSDKPGHQFLRRSSLGRPLRQAKERVTTYKEMPLHVKLRRP